MPYTLATTALFDHGGESGTPFRGLSCLKGGENAEENAMSLDTAAGQTADASERTIAPAVVDRYARDLVERARPIGASDRILDLGCGTGIVARVLRERLGGAANIVGVDPSPPMIEKAMSLEPELDWRVANATALPFADGSFDLVLCQEMHHFASDRTAVLREVRRVLSPGGRFLVSTWRPRSEQPVSGVALGQALTQAGFTHVRVEKVSLTEAADDPSAPSAAEVATALAPQK
jgi:ubiquinone/menaquinone biosynthesis C-methylase UbiE